MTGNVSDSMVSQNLYAAHRKCLSEISIVNDEVLRNAEVKARRLQDVRMDNIITVSIASRLPQL